MSLSDIIERGQANGLASLKLAELRQVAAAQGLKGTSKLRKGDLVAAIENAGKGGGAVASDRPEQKAEQRSERNERGEGKQADRRDEQQDGHASSKEPENNSGQQEEQNSGNNEREDRRNNRHNDGGDNHQGRRRRNRRNRRNRRGGDRGHDRNNGHRNNGHGDGGNHEDGGENRKEQQDHKPEPQEAPVAGILDFADANTAFIRTTGYHAGPTDVYVPINTVRKYGMRHGDAIVGTIRPNAKQGGGRGRNRQKFTPLHSVETVNGLSPEQAAQRPDFSKLTPLYPNQRLRLETTPKVLTTRVIDLIMPIGKGQRALIVSPPKAGKTTILQDIANAISTNNPECYLMVVLVDERPEEVTDMQRSVNGEVIASTFDRPPKEHTAVAELAVERAKRLVEQGKDVVLLLDSITRLGRAYNNSSPASGRILSGGVDSNALYPPKRFLGAARNIEHGGSLTIIATAMVETGSAGDTVIFEEFKGTGNAELKLDRKIAERRVFPAVDVNPSGTRKDELLLGPDEARVMHKLRRILSALDPQAAIDLLIKQLRKNKTNRDFMIQIASSAPLADEEDD
ncbi:transcription termination factor Rho [uncultured Corynebacterium sp.]|uniref:transcription termination factor Rho n=1 Tax=uncultured Corynebacterium sp. TaxID=159447 RepID=UPI00288B64FF|nr:transcription termination factor Rho [uncultured Corynebacterium sp.]